MEDDTYLKTYTNKHEMISSYIKWLFVINFIKNKKIFVSGDRLTVQVYSGLSAMAQLMNICYNSIYGIKPNCFVILSYLEEPYHRIGGSADIKIGRKRRKSSAWPLMLRQEKPEPSLLLTLVWNNSWNWPEHDQISAIKKSWVKTKRLKNKISNEIVLSRLIFYIIFLILYYYCYLKWHFYLYQEEEWNSLLMSRQYYTRESSKQHWRKKNMKENWVKLKIWVK